MGINLKNNKKIISEQFCNYFRNKLILIPIWKSLTIIWFWTNESALYNEIEIVSEYMPANFGKIQTQHNSSPHHRKVRIKLCSDAHRFAIHSSVYKHFKINTQLNVMRLETVCIMNNGLALVWVFGCIRLLLLQHLYKITQFTTLCPFPHLKQNWIYIYLFHFTITK